MLGNNVKRVSELGSKRRRATEFQALPFTEPATGLIYARARWYDPSTGSFLSPDPLGYQDSSNLYAFAGGDPVNGRDPTGTSVVGKAIKRVGAPATRALVKRAIKNQLKKTMYRKVQHRLRRRGLGNLFQVHHILGQQFFKTHAAWFKKIGLDLDTSRNFVILPTKAGRAAGIKASRRAIHQGGHLGDYVKNVERRIAEVMRREGAGEITPQQAFADIRQLQGELREGLMKGTIALSSVDAAALSSGGSIAVGLGFTVVSAASLDAAADEEVESMADTLADEYLSRDRDKNAYAKYLTAGQYTGGEGVAGFVGQVVDFFNPAADVIEITDLIEDVYDWAAGVEASELLPEQVECPGCGSW